MGLTKNWRYRGNGDYQANSIHVIISLFSELHHPTSGSVSHIPCSWRVMHILLCLIGVNNVYFMTSLPRFLRIASLVYHVTVLCVSAPVLVLYIYSIRWSTAITSIVERVNIIVYNSSVISLGLVYMINALKANHTSEFLGKWHSFCSDKADGNEVVEIKRFRRIRIALAFSTISHFILCLTITLRLFSIIDFSKQCEILFPSLNEPWLLKVMCAIFMVVSNFSTFSVSLTTCLCAFVTTTLAEEFDNLYQVICKLASSSCPVMAEWKQVRIRHAALVSLVCLYDQLSTMLVGPILVGYAIYLCSTLYYVVVVHAGVIGIINVIIPIAVLWAIITPANILQNMVSQMVTLLDRSRELLDIWLIYLHCIPHFDFHDRMHRWLLIGVKW